MRILHISSITNNKASGMSIVVPEHCKYQNLYADVALLNCSNYKPKIREKTFPVFTKEEHCQDGDISKLPEPFNNPDLVILHGLYIPFYYKIVNGLIKKRIPYVVIPHGSLTKKAQKIKPFKKIIGNTLIFNKIIKNAIAIQYLTEEERRTSIAKNVDSFISFNGIRLDENRKKYTSGKNTFNLIFIGRLDPFHKGLDYLLEACNVIREEMRENNIKLSIYGPDHNNGKKKIERIISKYDINDIVSLNNGIFGEEKIEKLLNSDVYIQTSRFEGQPLAIMEALSYGIPVIVSPGTNMAKEVFENNCGWVTEFTIKDIAKTILKAYSEREKLSILSKNAIKFINNTYNWEKVSYHAVNQYQKILNSYSRWS